MPPFMCSSVSLNVSSRHIVKSRGDSTHPCRIPHLIGISPDFCGLLIMTFGVVFCRMPFKNQLDTVLEVFVSSSFL